MKNDMKLIMESWKSNVINENVTYPPDSVYHFLKDLTESTNSEDSIEKKIVKALKTTGDQLEQNKVAKVSKTIVEKGFFLGVGTLVGVATGGVAPLLGAALGMLIDTLMQGAFNQVKKLIDVFNIPDADRAQYPTADLWDISDDLIKVLKGPNNKFDREEFKGVAEVYIDIIKVLQQLKKEEEEEREKGDSAQYQAFLRKPITSYGLVPADTAAKEKYSKQIGLNADLTIPKP